MKRLFILLFAGMCATGALYSCGGEKKSDATEEEANAEEYDEYETAEPEKASSDDLIAQGQVLVDASDCKTCHHATNKIVGPAHAEVAKKYDFTQANVSMLAGKIMNGGSGNWGEIPMTPHTDISKADAEKMAMYVLSLDGEKIQE
ncbi:MAG TPA: c-type cytochrome [Chryseosolibacter sp.]|nr:c-type cytochrome [Chryseosolibacter sp.]